MEILHVSAECYPMAKAGGLADVVGALPKYQQQLGHIAKVVMPMHKTSFLFENEWEVVHKGTFLFNDHYLHFTIIKEIKNLLGFDLYCIDINGLLDREKIYGYDDDTDRYIAFQIAVTEWLACWQHQPDIVHLHDHHAALVPFMLKHCFQYQHISSIKSILTIHNAEYQGWMWWDKARLLPAWDTWKWGLLEWNNTVNALACGIKCADKVTTVSPGYLKEIMNQSNGLEALFTLESAKCYGIINGIDYQIWNPNTDTFIFKNYNHSNFREGKELNKKKICNDYGFSINEPLIIFIGRLVQEKAADLLAPALNEAFEKYPGFNFMLLGSGETETEHRLVSLSQKWMNRYYCHIGYNESLSHLMYAAADFLLMPSRVEPCGLNQLYALRYGTIPVVRSVGGLKDTVIDIEDNNGNGITFMHASIDDIIYCIHRCMLLYQNAEKTDEIIARMMTINNSWEESTLKYLDVYVN